MILWFQFNLNQTVYYLPNKINVLVNIAYWLQELSVQESGYFVVMFLQKAKVLSGIHLNTWKYDIAA